MAESTKVRLVRCPKCENVLPELADYSVYQCGGCGAVLRARNKIPDGDTLSEKSDGGVVNAIEARMEESQAQGMADLSYLSDVDVKSNAESLRSEEKKPERDDDPVADRAVDQSEAKSGKLVVEDGVDVNVDRDNVAGKERSDSVAQNGNLSESWRSGRISSLQRREKGEAEGSESGARNEVGGLRYSTSNHQDEGPSNYKLSSSHGYAEEFGNQGSESGARNEVGGLRYSTSNHQDEGPSNYKLSSSHGYAEEFRNQDDRDRDSRVQYVEKDREELLRKIDELKQQLSRSANLTDKPSDMPPVNGRMVPPNPHHDFAPWVPGSSASNGAAMQFYAPGTHAPVPPYFNHHPEPFPYNNGHQNTLHGVHPSMQKSSQISGYRDPFGHHLPQRDPHQVPGQFQPVHGNFSGHYYDTGPDPFGTYPSNAAFHPPACSCYQCYNRHPGVPAPLPHASFSNQRFPGTSSSPVLYQDIPRAFGSNVHASRNSVPLPMNDHGLQSHMRWSSNINSEMGGFVHFHPRKVVFAGSGRHYHPIGGGAPFLTCYNCFELLKIPKKVLLSAKKQQKVQCGACSAIINFSFLNKKLIVSSNKEAGQASTVADDGSRMVMIDKSSYSYGTGRRTNATFSSDDYDDSGYDFQAIDPDPTESLIVQGLDSAKPQEMQSFSASSPSLTEDETSPDGLAARREGADSDEQPVKAILSPPQPGSPLQHYFDYSNYHRAVSRLGKGNRSSRSDQEKAITNKATARQNSMKEASLATEMDVSSQEYPTTGVSQEAVSGKEDNQAKSSKGVESFFANFIKKSLKDIARSNQVDERGRSNVSVNGRAIPDRLVRKAEKLAGPVHPGQYWYDPKAGFWGVMGGPCLGMIPPGIEEFNYPMLDNCSGGDTGIFVNGRELHQDDLNLLASRGLPTETDRCYIVEMSGRVLDEDTGEELESLGKLAPTVEKKKHGFGMKVPKVVAA